ncbi:Ran-specific GTPase-activating protein 30, partial [Coemansia erecta]
MDELFSNLAIQTVQLVGKAAFGAAGTIALKRVTDYVHRVPHTAERQTEVERLRAQFESKLRIITPAIDLIDIISARGHSTMASVLQLTNSLRSDIVAFSAKLMRLDQMLDDLGDVQIQKSDKSLVSLFRRAHNVTEPAADRITRLNDSIVVDLRALLANIEDAVPLLNLALTTSGAHLGSALPSDISPSRLMQASALLSRADTWFGVRSKREDVMVGDPFTLRLYSLFVGSVRPKSKHDFTWKEEFARCQVALWRVAATADLGAQCADVCYELRVVEDQNDGRYHEDTQGDVGRGAQPAWVASMAKRLPADVRPGRVVHIPLEDIGGLHYTSAGSLLNIEDSNAPVLVISFEDRRSGETTAVGSGLNIANSSALPSLEMTRTTWYALEVVTEDADELDASYGSSASSDSDDDSSSNASDNASDDGSDDGSSSRSLLEINAVSETSQSETSESDESESDESSESDGTGSEYSAPSSSASDLSELLLENNGESDGSDAKHNGASDLKPQGVDDIDKLADSIASLCTIDPSLPASKHTSEHTKDAGSSPIGSSSGSDAEAVASAEYFGPVEFLANEWRLCTLSLLEYMVRLASIEICEQASHLEVPDEKLRLYLLSAPSGTGVAPGNIPGDPSLRSTPYRPSMLETTTPTGRRGQSPLALGVRHHRTPSALGSPAAR